VRCADIALSQQSSGRDGLSEQVLHGGRLHQECGIRSYRFTPVTRWLQNAQLQPSSVCNCIHTWLACLSLCLACTSKWGRIFAMIPLVCSVSGLLKARRIARECIVVVLYLHIIQSHSRDLEIDFCSDWAQHLCSRLFSMFPYEFCD
jgi:hypothetical protein